MDNAARCPPSHSLSSSKPIVEEAERAARRRRTWSAAYQELDDAGAVCRRFGISRPTLRKWLRRYGADGDAGLMERSRRPDLSRISMRLDHRAACLAPPAKATQRGRVDWWVNLSTMTSGKKIAVPLLGHEHHRARIRRGGHVTDGVQVNMDHDGRLSFGVVVDEGMACAASSTVTGRTSCAAQCSARRSARAGTSPPGVLGARASLLQDT